MEMIFLIIIFLQPLIIGMRPSLVSLPRNTMYIHMTTGEWVTSVITMQPPSISQYADDAASLMSALGYDSMNVYGASIGSSTSQQLVIDHPERVRKLILDSNTYSVRIPETKVLLGIIESEANNSSEPQGIRNEAEANLKWNGSYDELSGITKDVMLVVGTEDILTPQAVSLQIAGQINGSWLVRFKGLPHTGYLEAPVQYGQNALNFLEMNESPLGNQ